MPAGHLQFPHKGYSNSAGFGVRRRASLRKGQVGHNAGVKSRKAAAGSFSMKSVLQLADFYERNRERLERTRGDMEVSGMPYPQMKLLDMGFWQLGFELDAGRDAKADA